MEAMGYSTGSSLLDTVGSAWLTIFGGAQARDVSGNTKWSKLLRKSLEGEYAEMMDRLVYTWDDVRETAATDDKFRAGMFDESTTNNESNKSVNITMNIGAPQVNSENPKEFINGLVEMAGDKVVGSRYIAEAFDTRRIK